MGSSAVTVQWCTMIVKKKGLLGPLLLLLLSIPSISCDHCRPHHDDYDAGKCFGSTIAIVFGVVGSICLCGCCVGGCKAALGCDDDDDNKAAQDPENGKLEGGAEVKTTLINQPSQHLAGVDRERTPVASKPNQQAMERLLRTSASRGEVEAVTALLDSGVGVDAGDQEGHTALYLACKEDRVDTVRLLLARGASPHVLPSPLEVAITKGNYTVAEALEAANNPA